MEDQNQLTTLATRDPVATIMFVAAILLIVLDGSSVLALAHTKHIEVLRLPMFATGAFAIAGIVLGLVRSLRAKHAA